jgi:PhzF family phenazine biosynthesis protein
MKIPIWIVDAFCTSEPFSGNPAAVCILDRWLPDETMQAIGAQNNLSETAFLVRDEYDGYRIRWFTPTVEVTLCGHATLASGYVVREVVERGVSEVRFSSASGNLLVVVSDDRLALDFPADRPIALPTLEGLADVLGGEPVETHRGLLGPIAVLRSESEVKRISIDAAKVLAVTPRLSVTAPGDEVDFVSRFFAPGAGILEDPVTGAAHTMLTPYWADRLGKQRLHARQLSARGGELWCDDGGHRVRIGGRTRMYLHGEIEI